MLVRRVNGKPVGSLPQFAIARMPPLRPLARHGIACVLLTSGLALSPFYAARLGGVNLTHPSFSTTGRAGTHAYFKTSKSIG